MEPVVVGRNMSMSAVPEEVTQFIVTPTETVSDFDATAILLQSIVQMAGAMAYRRADRTGVAVVAIRGHPDVGDGLGGLKELLRGRRVTMLIEHRVDHCAVTINGTTEIAPMPVHLDVGVRTPILWRTLPGAGPIKPHDVVRVCSPAAAARTGNCTGVSLIASIAASFCRCSCPAGRGTISQTIGLVSSRFQRAYQERLA